MEYISFPGLGIEPFHIDKVAFNLFGRDVAWYGVLITCGMILAVFCALWLAKYEKISADNVYDLALTVIICGVLGARAYYVIFTWNELDYVVTNGTFWQNLWGTFRNCIAMWDGGLAIYGGIICGLISGFIFSKIKKIEFLKIFDILVPCVLIGQVIGRWGNFINVEAHGGETTLPWRMGIHFIAGDVVLAEQFVHPTFLYESLWNLIGLIIVLCIYKKKKFNGQNFCYYLMWYGFGRMLIEGLRTDSLYIWNTQIRVSQLIGFCSVIIGIVLFIILYKRSKVKKLADEAYAPIFEEKPAEENGTDENANAPDKSDSSDTDTAEE